MLLYGSIQVKDLEQNLIWEILSNLQVIVLLPIAPKPFNMKPHAGLTKRQGIKFIDLSCGQYHIIKLN